MTIARPPAKGRAGHSEWDCTAEEIHLEIWRQVAPRNIATFAVSSPASAL